MSTGAVSDFIIVDMVSLRTCSYNLQSNVVSQPCREPKVRTWMQYYKQNFLMMGCAQLLLPNDIT